MTTEPDRIERMLTAQRQQLEQLTAALERLRETVASLGARLDADERDIARLERRLLPPG